MAYKANEAWGERRADAALGPAPSDATNVLLLVLDTQAQSRMSLHGNPRQTTPNIDRFAARSITFDQAYATSSWTLPSHASLFTGLWYQDLSVDTYVPLSEGPTTLAEVMLEQEYRTGAFMANELYTSVRTGFSRGFGTYRDYPIDLEAWVASNRVARWMSEIGKWVAGIHSVSRVNAEDVNDEFLGWLDRDDRPFFAVLNYFDLHFPYEAPAPFDTRFADPAPRWWLPGWGLDWDYTKEPRYSDAFIQEIVDSYDSALAYLDHHIGLLLDALEERGVLDRTLIVLTSDHGEAFGERGLVSHSKSLYRPEVLVPLVIWHPSLAAGGTRVPATVSIRDIPQTVLDLLGVSDDRIAGRSLRRHWEGDAGTGVTPEPEIILTQIRARPWYQPGGRILDGDLDGAIVGTLHYIRSSIGEELFDVATDPGQFQNLAGDPAYAEQLLLLRSAVDAAGSQGRGGP